MLMCYIKVVDNQPVDHPVLPANLIEAFGEVPSEYKLFWRTEKPELGMFEEWDTGAVQYGFVNGIWTDLWPKRLISQEKRQAIELETRQAIMQSIPRIREYAVEQLSTAPEYAKTIWQTHIDELDAFVIPDDVSVFDIEPPKHPVLPKVDANGNLLTTELSGSAPNVIG